MVTIDIEDNAINVLVAQGKAVKTCISEPLDSGLVKDGVVLSPELVAQKIKALLEKHNIQDKSAIVSVSGVHSIYRIARLPKIGGDLMHEAVRREMTRLIPVPLEELHTSWQQIPVNDTECIVPMVGIPKETVDFTLSTLKLAGIESKNIDVRPLAIARIVDEKDAIIINVQPFSFDIILMVEGIPEIVRSLSFSETLVSPEDKVKEIKEELERTFNFYNNSKPAKPLNEGFVTFISGYYKDLLAGLMQYRVKPMPVPFSFSEEFDRDPFVVNMGLALKTNKPGAFPLKINFNVLPEVYQPKPLPLARILSWVMAVIGVGMLALMVVNWQTAASHTRQLQSQISSLDKQAAAIMANKGNIDNLQKQIQALKSGRAAVQGVLDNLSAKRNTTSSELGELVALMPGEITIVSIAYGAGWSVNGEAKTSDMILIYAYALEKSPRFQDVQLGSVAQTGFNQWKFTVTAVGTPAK